MVVSTEAIRWFHQIPLPGGVTPGVDDSAAKLARLHLPDLAGLTVLDVGAWDGFFSFEAERRGAVRVLATDSYVWEGRTWGSKAGFEHAREALGSGVEDRTIDVMDLSPEKVGMFDVTLCLGVLYHMAHPLLMLERVASVTDGLLVLETETAHVATVRPVVRYFLDGDDLCAPNVAWLERALRHVGFQQVEVVWRRSLLTSRSPSRGRVVVHARR